MLAPSQGQLGNTGQKMRCMHLKEMRRWLFPLMLFLSIQGSFALDYPDYVGYVNDYAHLLSAAQASALNQELRDFDNRTTIEIAVVTVESIGSESPRDYAINLGNYWGVGKRGKNNGILVLVAMQSRDIWIEVGSGLVGELEDQRVQQIVDDVIIPRFRAGQPDQGIIQGVRSIVLYLDGASPSIPVTLPASGIGPTPAAESQPAAYPPPPASALGDGSENANSMWIISAAFLAAVTGGLYGFRRSRKAIARKNEAKLLECRRVLGELPAKESAALEALGQLEKSYVQSIWKDAREALDSVDLDSPELKLLEAERISRRGWISAGTAASLISIWEKDASGVLKVIEAAPRRLAEARQAQREFASTASGLKAAFEQADQEIKGGEISMATRKNLEKARQSYQQALSMADKPADEVDWLVLADQLRAIENAVEQVSRDVVRDRGIAEKIRGQDAEELLARMRQTVGDAEEELGKSDAARPDLRAARDYLAQAQEYRKRDMNTIDLYLMMVQINNNVLQGHQHIKHAAAEAQRGATAVRHTGFGSSGSHSFGGGRMGGGSHGGGKW
jgi:uncharacterized membrane protein YgcG